MTVEQEHKKTAFAGVLLEWFSVHRRNLPWRETSDPYRIWISEVILQQTRIVQGRAYYERFTEQFPDVETLASASEDQVLKCWQGLGYYSRARNLHAAARDVVERFGGRFPDRYEDVRSLKGIGDYTAAAICSIAFGQPFAVVDGNVYRVLSRYFGIDQPIDGTTGRRYFAQLAQQLLDVEHPGNFNEAMMDFGALQCIPGRPNCEKCPFTDCRALLEDRVLSLPVKTKKTILKDRFFHYLNVRLPEEMTLLVKREQNDIWKNLYEFPLIEAEHFLSWEEVMSSPVFRELFGKGKVQLLGTYEMPRHILSHRIIHAVFYEMRFEGEMAPAERYLTIKKNQSMDYPVSRLMELYGDITEQNRQQPSLPFSEKA